MMTINCYDENNKCRYRGFGRGDIIVGALAELGYRIELFERLEK